MLTSANDETLEMERNEGGGKLGFVDEDGDNGGPTKGLHIDLKKDDRR